jgi:hypothetical protein
MLPGMTHHRKNVTCAGCSRVGLHDPCVVLHHAAATNQYDEYADRKKTVHTLHEKPGSISFQDIKQESIFPAFGKLETSSRVRPTRQPCMLRDEKSQISPIGNREDRGGLPQALR